MFLDGKIVSDFVFSAFVDADQIGYFSALVLYLVVGQILLAFCRGLVVEREAGVRFLFLLVF